MGLGSEHGALDFYSDLRMRLTKILQDLLQSFHLWQSPLIFFPLLLVLALTATGVWRRIQLELQDVPSL
jgi:hypothetical protein